MQRDGTDVTAEATFTPAAPPGMATVTPDAASSLAGYDVAALEGLSQDGAQAAAYTGIDDDGQTVQVTPNAPEIGTTATDDDYEATADGSVTIDDELSYSGLAPCKEHTLIGTLLEKETGKPVCADGKAVTSTVALVPDVTDGMQEVTFAFDGAELSGRAVVAFAPLALEGQEVASHADVNDEGQTVRLVPPETPQTPEAQASGGKLLQTGDELPIAGICVLAAAGCAVSVIGIARSIGSHREGDGGEEN